MNFTAHCALVPLRGIIPPQRVATVPVSVETDRARIDALADFWLAVERKRERMAASCSGEDAATKAGEGDYLRCSMCGEEVISGTCIYLAGKPVCARCAEDNQLTA